MSTVDEVLATAEVVDAVCVIDGETRIISVPNEYKELGVESDENVTRIKFQCPKIVGDNIDLTEYNLYINYRNAGNKLNSYLVEDATVTGDVINFSWLLSRHVTESPGTISYIVCAKKSDYTGVINEWNTKVATGTVGVGLEATEEIEEQNIDIIDQILRSIVKLENSTGGSGVSDYDLLDNKPVTNLTSTNDNTISLRDLPTGVYRLSGDFTPYAGSNYSFGFANKQLVNIITKAEGTHVQIFYPIDNTVQFMSIMVDPTAEDGYSLEQTNVKLNDLQTKSQVVTISLPAASWVEEGSVYKQTVTISSATSTSQVDLRPSKEQLQTMIASGISLMTANDNGTVTVFSIGGVPESDYSIQAIVSEANTVGGTSGAGPTVAGGQPKPVTSTEEMTDIMTIYLYLGSENGYEYGHIYVYKDGTWENIGLYGKGQDGYSPEVDVAETAEGVTITINGDSYTVKNGSNGQSPTVSVTDITNGHRIIVTDADGVKSFDVLNGENGTATNEQVAAWLDDHPEATTTVQDGAVSSAKLSSTVNEQIAQALIPNVYTLDLSAYAEIGFVSNQGVFSTSKQTHVKVDIPISDIAEKCADYLEDKLILNIRPDRNGVYLARLWCTLDGVDGYNTIPNKSKWIGGRNIVPFASITSAFLQIARADGAAITNKSEAIQAISITVERLWKTGELSPYGEFNRHAFEISQYFSASMTSKSFNGIAFPVMPGETLIVDGTKLNVSYIRLNQNFEYVDGYKLGMTAVEGSVAYVKDGVCIKSYTEWISRNFIIPNGVRYIVIEKSSLSDDAKFYLDTRPVVTDYDQHCVSALKTYYPQLKKFKGMYDSNNNTYQYISSCGSPLVISNTNVSYRPYLNGSPGDFWIFRNFQSKKFANTIARYGDVVWFDGTTLRALRNPYAYEGNETAPNTHYDIVIVGGGAGGVGAAYALCNSGLRVCLIEKQNGLGGTHTSAGMVSQIASPIGDWYKAVAQDAYNWAAMRCGSKSYASSDESETTFDKLWRGSQYNFSSNNLGNLNLYNPYYLYQKYHEDLTAGGIEIRYNREFISCKELNGAVISATFRNLVSGGEETVSGDYFIDCTGDCYLARYNKVLDTDFFIGSDPASRYNEAAIGILPNDPHYDINTLELVYLYSSNSAYAEKDSDLPDVAGVTKGQNSNGGFPYYNHTEVLPHSTNSSYYPNLCNFVSPDYYEGITQKEFVDNGYDITRILAENKAKAHYKLNKKTASTFFIEAMPMLAIREGYRMKCEYMVTQADVETTITSENLAEKHIVALSSWYVDIHKNSGSVVTSKVSDTFLNGIPYEAMIPCTQKNVLVACRGYGASHIGLSAIRLTKTMLSLGYAAGMAAKQARARWLDDFRAVDVAQLQSDIGIAALMADIETYVLNPLATYTIANTLTNVTSSNRAASITEGYHYSATLTAAGGYTLDAVTVTMGGTDVTSTVYADGTITIEAVTGDLVITASAVVAE